MLVGCGCFGPASARGRLGEFRHDHLRPPILMNTRGLTELVFLGVGQQIRILDNRLYSLMVIMAVVTTAMTGPLLRWLAGEDAEAPRPKLDHSAPST
jgi:Kef-type K+ transport system membrane component KefB